MSSAASSRAEGREGEGLEATDRGAAPGSGPAGAGRGRRARSGRTVDVDDQGPRGQPDRGGHRGEHDRCGRGKLDGEDPGTGPVGGRDDLPRDGRGRAGEVGDHEQRRSGPRRRGRSRPSRSRRPGWNAATTTAATAAPADEVGRRWARPTARPRARPPPRSAGTCSARRWPQRRAGVDGRVVVEVVTTHRGTSPGHRLTGTCRGRSRSLGGRLAPAPHGAGEQRDRQGDADDRRRSLRSSAAGSPASGDRCRHRASDAGGHRDGRPQNTWVQILVIDTRVRRLATRLMTTGTRASASMPASSRRELAHEARQGRQAGQAGRGQREEHRDHRSGVGEAVDPCAGPRCRHGPRRARR